MALSACMRIVQVQYGIAQQVIEDGEVRKDFRSRLAGFKPGKACFDEGMDNGDALAELRQLLRAVCFIQPR